MQQPNNTHRRRSRSHSGSGSSIGSSSTASSRSSSSSAERRRRAKTASLKRKNLPRLRQGKSSGTSKRGVRKSGVGGGAGTTPALDPLPTGPRRLSYIPESSAEWDDIENSSHDDDKGSMDTDDMEARLEELEAEARRSSGFGLEDDDKVDKRRGHANDRKPQQQPKQQSSTATSSSARSDFDVPLEDSLDDFMRRKSSLSQSRRQSRNNSEVTDGADVSGVWSNVANEFGSVPGGPSVGSREDSLPSLDLTEHTGNTSGRSLEYSWPSTNKGSGDGRWNSRGSSSEDRPMPSRSGSGYSSTDSWGAPRRVEDDGRKGEGGTDAADATTTNNSRNNDRPHDRLHHMSTGDLSYDTWDSSSGISYGGDSLSAANDDQGNGGNNGGGRCR